MIWLKIPKISCVMVTSGRFEHLKKSLQCYLNQTYKNREMVIISQGNDEANCKIEHYISTLGLDDITFIKAPQSLTLGSMRNLSIEVAVGDIICQWDDDDLYHQDRIITQYRELRKNSANIASVYSSFLKYFKNSAEVYWCDWSGEPILSHKFLCGSVMFFKKAFHMYNVFYPETGGQCHVEEDLNVLEKLTHKGDVVPVHDGNQYVYVFHGENTYDIEHHKLTLDTKWGKLVLDKNELLDRKKLIETTFNNTGMKETVFVRSKDEIAFTYCTEED